MQSCLSLVFISISAVLAAESDCNERPDMFALKNCCKTPPLNLTKYQQQCAQYLINGAHIAPCTFECVLNAAKALNGTTLVMDKVVTMLHNVFQGDQQFVDIYAEGYRNCSTQKEDMIRTLKRRRLLLRGKCTSIAVMYSICAHRYTYINCPEGSWSNTSSCNKAKEFSIKCELGSSKARRG